MKKTMEISKSLLKAWPLSPCAADVWRAAVGQEMDGKRIARAYLAAIARSSSPQDAFRELVEEGSFAVADELQIEHLKEHDETWDDRLREARSACVSELENSLTELEKRCQRVHHSDLLDSETKEEVRKLMGQDKAAALDTLAPVVRVLEREEEAHAKCLLAQLTEAKRTEDPLTVGSQDRMEAVRRAIRTKEFDVAEHLLTVSATGQGGVDRGSLPTRPKVGWPYRSQSPGTILDWLLKRAGGSKDFYAKWCPQDDDEPAWKLLKSLEALFKSGGNDERVVIRFVDALETFLGQRPLRSRKLERLPGGRFRTRLMGLGDPGAPALAAVTGVWLYLGADGGELAPNAAARDSPVVLFSVNHEAPANPGCLQLTARDLFLALPDPAYRRVKVLRSLVPQIPLPLPFGDRPSKLSPLAFFGREEEQRRLMGPGSQPIQLVFGCPGVGTSALLQKATWALENRDWEIVHLQELTSGEALERLMKDSCRAGLVATSDGVPYDMRNRLPELLDCERRFGGRFRVLMVGDLDGRDRLAPQLTEAQCWQLQPLPFLDVRALVGRLLDFRGVRPFDAPVLDRMAFYTGGRPALVHLLVDSLIFRRSEAALPTSIPLKREELEDIVRDRRFKEVARRWLLAPIERDPSLHTVYACVIACLDLDGSLNDRIPRSSCEEIHEFLIGEGFAFSVELFLRCLARLAELEVIEPIRSIQDRVVLAPGAVARMCVALSGAPYAYFAARKPPCPTDVVPDTR